MVSFQSQLQTINNDIPLLDAAIPVDPNINQLLADIRLAATQTDVVLNRTDVGEIQLVRDKKTGVVSSILVSMDATTSYPNFKAFHNTLSKQKRLKKITSLEITRAGSAIASTSAGLKINMEIEAYYL